MNGTKATALIMAVSLASLSLLAPGCLTLRSEDKYGGKGQMVSQTTMDQIEPGKTSKGKLVAILGEPTRTKEYDDGVELYVYECTRRSRRGIEVLLLLDSSTDSMKIHRLYYEIRNNVVQTAWRD